LFTSISRRRRIFKRQLVTKIAQLAATPADVGEAVPVRLNVPATAATELWDSGLPVAAHERDTLETLAASYHVPLWAVAQVNSVAKNAPLTEGQRIIVPRHPTSMTTPSPVLSYVPSELVRGIDDRLSFDHASANASVAILTS
jgi:hypothetical protein